MIEKFFDAIYGDQKGYIDIMTREAVGQGPVAVDKWFDLEKWKHKAVKYCEMRHDEDVYCSVSVFPVQSRKANPEATAQVVWADADTCDPENFRVTPSIIVETSPGRWHVWWCLDEPVLATEAAKVSQKIAHAHREEGCDNGWNHSKVLRVPGTSNLKTDQAAKVHATYTGTVYSLSELDAAYKDIEVATQEDVLGMEVPEPLSLSQRASLEDKFIRGTAFEPLYTEEPPEGASWWKRLFRLQHELFRAGLQPNEVFDLCKHSKCDKFARDHRPDSDLWDTVRKAYQDHIKKEEEPQERLVQGKELETPVPCFLTDEEKLKLKPTFIDSYVTYVASRTSSEEQFQRALAYMLLSAVFSDRGYIPRKFAFEQKMWLNLWTIIAAPTTTFKSTAKNIFLEVLRLYERNVLGDDKIDIGSNTTKEALSTLLGERDGKVSLVQTDEVAVMFKEAYTKNHMEGLLGFYTELYDGQVPVSLRVTKGSGQDKRANTKFLFVGVGIDKGKNGVAEVLTKADFESGFLARMLWVTAKDRERKDGADYPEYAVIDGPEDVKDMKMGTARIMMDLKRRASKFNPENPSPIILGHEAAQRYSDWCDQLHAHAKTFEDSAVIACANRLKVSVEKATALLAMYDGQKVATVDHVLSALEQAQYWYEDFLTMFQNVSASAFEKQCDEVEKFISQGKSGERKSAEIKRKFPLRPQEIGDILSALVGQGRVRNIADTYQVLAG